jgi:hypothetical protein
VPPSALSDGRKADRVPGIFVYTFQGQYTLPLAYQGVSRYAWQTVGNALALVTGIIAAGLYSNIGIKVAYYCAPPTTPFACGRRG